MTFQEFFLKKKIDLEALKTDKSDLFTEFQEHYSLMGSKSFDHTKKYWFNNLRIAFPLSEQKENELKEAFKSLETPKSELLIKFTETSNETKTATRFKPHFKASVSIKSEEEPYKLLIENGSPTPQKPPLFKPRFKAGTTNPIVETENVIEKENQTINNLQENLTKPAGFKPRFKAGLAKAEDIIKSDDEQVPTNNDLNNKEMTQSLGFKPRFKAGIKKSAEEIERVEPTEMKTENIDHKPLGFKPRFKK